MNKATEKSNQAKKNTLLNKYKHYVNEKMIFAHYFKRVFEEECRGDPDFYTAFEKRRREQREEGLDMNQKYDVVHSELQNAHTKWENFEKKKDMETDKLLAQNQEVINHIKDIKMEVYELNRKIDSQAEHKNGKISDEVFYKFFDDKKKKMNNLIKKYKDQVKSLDKQIAIKQQKIANKDSNNELKFIDFHQLQIENKKYVKEVDEKNKQLLKLKMTIGKIAQDKTLFKTKLAEQMNELESKKQEIRKKRADEAHFQELVEKQKKETLARNRQTNRLHTKLSKGGTLDISHHVREKNIEKELIHILENLQKKLDIEKIKSKGSI
ncbi:MAG: coiled-coil domain-containing protein [archaeon]|nr:coiled-coil domain-containing protein [archaeon]